MRTGPKLVLACLVGLAACGGGGSSTNVVPVNAFTGTITITSPLPAGAVTCNSTPVVTFTAGGVSPKTVTVAGGDCVTFTNSDTAQHQPGWRNSNPCPEYLTLPAPLSTGQSYTTPLLGGPKTCDWQDLLNPPGGGGGH